MLLQIIELLIFFESATENNSTEKLNALKEEVGFESDRLHFSFSINKFIFWEIKYLKLILLQKIELLNFFFWKWD